MLFKRHPRIRHEEESNLGAIIGLVVTGLVAASVAGAMAAVALTVKAAILKRTAAIEIVHVPRTRLEPVLMEVG